MTGTASIERDEAIERAYRQYIIGCAEHVNNLISLPEHICALAVLKEFDAEPTLRNKARLAKVYSLLEPTEDRLIFSPSTVADEIRVALQRAVHHTLCLKCQESVTPSAGVHFLEAALRATQGQGIGAWERVMKDESAFQYQLWQQLFDKF